MKIKTKNANIFIYVLILVNITLIIGYVVFSNIFTLENNLTFSNISSALSENLIKKAELNLETVKQFNTNGGGFSDNIGCPGQHNTNYIQYGQLNASGVLVTKGQVASTMVYDDKQSYCSFKVLGYDAKLFHDENKFTYGTISNSLITMVQSGTILINEESYGSYYVYFENIPMYDYLDDNFDSDNFRTTSTGNIVYPDNYIDDDTIPRMMVYSSVPSKSDYYSVFWNNYKIRNVINGNIYNDDNPDQTTKMGIASAVNLSLNISSDEKLDYSIKIVEFNKSIYENQELISPVISYESGNLTKNFGFLALNSSGSLVLNQVKNGQEIDFDLASRDYAIFIKNNSNNEISVQVSGEEKGTNKKVYINAIDDSLENDVEILVNHIVISEDNYIGEHYLSSFSKDYFSDTYDCKKSGELMYARSRYPGCDTRDIIICTGVGTGYTLAACNAGATTAGIHDLCIFPGGTIRNINNVNCDPNKIGFQYQWMGGLGGTNFLTATGFAINDPRLKDYVTMQEGGFINLSSFPVGTNKYTWTIDTPCKGDYRLPTKTEWENIVSAGNGVLWNYSGTSWLSVEDFDNFRTKLLLPLSGYRWSASGHLGNQGLYGYYWSSTSYNSSRTFVLYFGLDEISPSKDFYRANGFTVRCFKN